MKLVVRSATHGRGVFTEELIRVGARIIRFTGPFLRYEQTSASTYALQIGPDLYIGASGGFDDLVNHSCEPNAGLRIEGTTVDLYAVRDIEAGEEILFDYSTTLDEDDFTMRCQCGAPSCRGTIGDGKYLPEDLWRKYLSLGIIPEYVQKSRAALA
ncbi:MAG: SET domain-containing protein [Spirochaetia bacterium]